ncbi:LysR family transcriptional regulator [Halomonas sp. McH1-25]|uniref:LysR family transcriptional regulator n=1 Tax=unclassified Halomonas TaxID=2609666 RepID=UPI001EF6A0A5|nr:MULTISPECIES: LysR family transcriptional regulator [unclassified Halomonas]MCG7600145.1 LysR family transcriptional regulator [Halomonas sp. McH1-25]MCP1341394.1 LysR family transcriptional regulator [Halomonas sp. FL8]MCP1359661.1 LysR family transcriptional regulator [Halomonas sp. BBD45]MCP1365253.1 LysR family transcriptional regulator [Halomonas sp. BBD48]
MDTQSLEVFVHAVRTGSLSGAARHLKLTPMSATRRLAALEDELGVRLFQRTSRSISLTPEGENFLPFAIEMLETQEAARATVSSSLGSATGLLRVTAPVTLGRKRIMPVVQALLEENPGLRIDLELNDAIVDIVASGIDLAIRIAPLKDSGLIARRLADNAKQIYATPSYLAQHGTPRTIEDLAHHQCLTFSNFTHWHFIVDGEERSVRVGGRFSSSGVDGFLSACVSGLGLAQLSSWDVKEELESGQLVVVPLEGAAPRDLAIWAVYPSRRQVLPKLRVFLDKLQKSLV